jgi:C4-dicarboxylate transporter DctM subunit
MGTALLLFGTMAVFLIIGVPIAFALGASVWATIVFSPDFTVTTGIIAQRIFGGLESASIMAIPFFILAGNLMTKGGISRRLVNFANSIVGGVRGGMALALVLACAFFAALSGSAPATVIAIGSMLYPEMVKMGYPKDRTAGLLVVSGGLGPIIPPSIIMVVYGTITGASISDMFTSGMFIGVIIMIVLMIVVLVLAHKEQWPKAEKRPTLKEFGDTFLRAIPAILLPVIILGGIYSGLLTPTESAAVAVVWALIAGMFIYREITVKDLVPIFIDSAKGAAMILFIIATSTAFSWIFAYSGISGELVHAIVGMHLSKTVFCIVVAIILVIFGTFLEGIATCVLMVPILWPIASSLGIDAIHFGMIVAISNVIGTMTPPVAVNIFSAASVTKLKMGQIAKGQIPFFIGYVLVFFAVVLIPAISTLFLG